MDNYTCYVDRFHCIRYSESYALTACTDFVERCNDGDVRLVPVSTENIFEGRVEVCYKEDYGTVCDQSFGIPEAAVVCSQLGFSRQGNYSPVMVCNWSPPLLCYKIALICCYFKIR